MRAPQRDDDSTNSADIDGAGDAETGRRVATIDRAADVLFLFANDDRPSLGVTEIATELNISKAVVHRILTSLKERDLVAADATTRRYSLGPAVLLLAARYHQQLDIRPLARDTLERLSAATGETATLSVRSGWERYYVDQVLPPAEVRMTVQIGRGYPLHAGSSSKAFLASIDESEQDAILASGTLDALTPATITDIDTLRAELDTIRSRGVATSLGERQVGAASVAAPVFDVHGVVAVISVCGPKERLEANLDEITTILLSETAALSARLGHR